MNFLPGLLCFTFVLLANSQYPPYTQDCQHGLYPPTDAPAQTVIPTYTINLDLPPERRWIELARYKAQGIKELIDVIKGLVKGFAGGILIRIIDKELPKLMGGLPETAVAEMTGISQAANIPLGEIFLYNLFYEFDALCTSIIAEDKHGEVFHGRNLDFGLLLGWDFKNDTWLLTEKLRPLIYNGVFVKDNQTVFKAVNFAGYIGVITGMKPYKYSLTVNERFTLKGSGIAGAIKWILGTRTGSWMGFLTRQIFETVDTFDEAKNILSTKELIGPIYFILGMLTVFLSRYQLKFLLFSNITEEIMSQFNLVSLFYLPLCHKFRWNKEWGRCNYHTIPGSDFGLQQR